jgi:hypothetical protein
MRARRGSWASLGGLSTSKCRIVALFENRSSSPGRMAQPRVDEGPIGRLEDDD